MPERREAIAGGTNIFGTLGILFITLKLCDVIDWSWWWVLAPFWSPLAVFVIVFLVAFVWCFLAEARESKRM